MLVFLPENTYELIKDNTIYNELITSLEESIFGNNDYIISHHNYDRTDWHTPLIEQIMNISNDTAIQQDLHFYLNTDINLLTSNIETHLFDLYNKSTKYLYGLSSQDRNLTYFNAYEMLYLEHKDSLSLIFHTIYYRICVTRFMYSESTFDEFIAFEQAKFNECLKDEIGNNHILFQQRLHMLKLYYNLIGQFIMNPEQLEKLLFMFDIPEYKYNKYNVMTLNVYLLAFQNTMDTATFNRGKILLDVIIDIINYAFTNREDFTKSLIQYNKSGFNEFLNIVKYILTITKKHLPNVYNILQPTIDNLTNVEKSQFFDIVSNDYNKYKSIFSMDSGYSTSWANAKKDMFLDFNILY